MEVLPRGSRRVVSQPVCVAMPASKPQVHVRKLVRTGEQNCVQKNDDVTFVSKFSLSVDACVYISLFVSDGRAAERDHGDVAAQPPQHLPSARDL